MHHPRGGADVSEAPASWGRTDLCWLVILFFYVVYLWLFFLNWFLQRFPNGFLPAKIPTGLRPRRRNAPSSSGRPVKRGDCHSCCQRFSRRTAEISRLCVTFLLLIPTIMQFKMWLCCLKSHFAIKISICDSSFQFKMHFQNKIISVLHKKKKRPRPEENL